MIYMILILLGIYMLVGLLSRLRGESLSWVAGRWKLFEWEDGKDDRMDHQGHKEKEDQSQCQILFDPGRDK